MILSQALEDQNFRKRLLSGCIERSQSTRRWLNEYPQNTDG
jgi:hypothetical protein